MPVGVEPTPRKESILAGYRVYLIPPWHLNSPLKN